MKKGSVAILAGLTGAVVFLGAELVQIGKIAKSVQKNGVTVNMGGAPIRITPPEGSGGQTVKLPPDAEGTLRTMHKVALGAALVAATLAVVVSVE
jgi:hypothetical protein